MTSYRIGLQKSLFSNRPDETYSAVSLVFRRNEQNEPAILLDPFHARSLAENLLKFADKAEEQDRHV